MDVGAGVGGGDSYPKSWQQPQKLVAGPPFHRLACSLSAAAPFFSFLSDTVLPQPGRHKRPL